MAEAILVLQDPEQAAKVLGALRLRILERLSEPGSASTLAPQLGLTRQQVNYHLRELEEVGVIEFQEERKRGNFMERVYRLVSPSIVIAPSALGAMAVDAETQTDKLAPSYLMALGARLIEDLHALGKEEAPVPTLAIETEIQFESESARAEFAAELATHFRHLAAKYHHPTGSAGKFRVLAAAHPTGNLS